MSSSIKISLLALVGAAAAIPHYGGHSKFHHSAGYAGPTGGWGHHHNSTGPRPTGTGVATPLDEKTTTTTVDETSTKTIFSTVYLTLSPSPVGSEAPASVGAAEVPTGASEACGPPTVYVTATEKVTVTVPAGGAASPSTPAYTPPAYTAPSTPEASSVVPSSVVPEAPSSTPAEYVAPSSVASFVLVSPSPVKEEASSSVAPVSTPAATPEQAYTSSAVVESSAAPASSATPSATPSSSPGYTGGKRGLAYRWDGAADCKSFAGKNFGFAWNWESDSRGDIGGINFIPTLRTLANSGDWAEKVEAAIGSGSTVVFGLNEPDIPSQANLDVASACAAWKTYMNPIAEKHSGVTIVGPSVSSSETEGQGLSWLSSFKENCPEATWGAGNYHWYGPASAGFDAFKAHIEQAYSQIGKPFWVTEFGLTGATAQESADFLGKAQTYLDSHEGCQGYSYFAVGSFDASANLLGNAESLTETGKVYVS